MSNQEKIGVGIITYNRLDFLQNLINSLVPCQEVINELIVVNDGGQIPDWDLPYGTWINNEKNINVGPSKNKAMSYLLDKGCKYIFTLEDDIIIKDRSVFERYIDLHKQTKLHHFNFGFSQRENLDTNLNPVYRKVIDYGKGTKLVLTKNILGAFTFYTREALQTIGLHHRSFNKGHGDHLELTYRAYKHKFGTPFWWFADLYESWNMIENQSNMTTDSVVRNTDFADRFNEARKNFATLHGCDIFQVPEMSEHEVIKYLKEIKNG